MILPQIHINGTSKKELIEDRLKVLRALRDSLDALRQTGPNGRDYYIEGNLKQAAEQHNNRMIKIYELILEIETEADEIDKIPDWRSRE